MRLEETFEVSASPMRAFDYLADMRNETKWNPWPVSIEKVSDGPIGKDARFRGKFKRVGTVEEWLSEYAPSKHPIYQSNTMDGRMVFDIESAGQGTNIRLVAEAHPKGIMKLMSPFMTAMMRGHTRDLAQGIRRELDR